MRILFLEDFKGRKAGREWDCPFAALGRQLIEAGTALAVEGCDLHLNPVTTSAAVQAEPAKPEQTEQPEQPEQTEQTEQPEQTAAEEPAAPPAPQPKRKGKK
jgi:uncharacterized membrane-anchored protein